MTTTPSRYCTHCGAPLAPKSRFCGQCGQAVARPPETLPPPRPPAPPKASPPPPPPPREQILGIVAVGKPKGLLGMRHDSYNVIVTPTHLVFAHVSPQLMKQATQQARNEAKQQGKGFLGQWGAQLAWMDVLHRQYAAMTMDAILRQYPGSFVLAHHQIRKVRFKRRHDDEGGQSNDELILRTVDGKLRFKLLTGNVRQVKTLLRQAGIGA